MSHNDSEQTNMGKGKIIANEYIYSILTRFLSIAISLCQSILAARYLGSALKGSSIYIRSITSIGAIIVTFGMHQAYPYFRKKYGKENIFVEYINAVRMVFFTAFLALLGASFFFSNVEVKAALLLIPIMGFADVLAYVCMIDTPNIRNRWWTIIYFLELCFVISLMLFTKASLTTAIILLGFADTLKIIVYSIILRTKLSFTRKTFKLAKQMAMFGFLPMLALLMTTLNYRVDVLMLKHYSIVSDSLLGIYSIGINVAERVVLIPDTLKGILASKLSKGADDSEVSKVCRLCLWASVLMCIVFLLVGDWGIRLLYGPEYDGAYQVMAISAVGAIFIGYFKLIAQYNIINRKQIYNVIILSISILVNIIGNLIFIPLYGINGAALATGIGHIVCGIVFVMWFCYKTDTRIWKMVIISKNDIKLVSEMLKGHKNDK